MNLELLNTGGRPLQTTLNEKKQAKIYERIIELITQVQPGVFSSMKASKIVELFKLGEGKPPVLEFVRATLQTASTRFLALLG
ncbi:MAG: hypothetical protein A2W66_07020 [Deltaproteobacteria bacterium RIFCSPLOWO2_02_56_12]|nr:MAG: hypothetical protein A2W66_07020 [Deltaproteobacteria bacterium RIFCSPLOWO2_02_56_12]